MKRLFNTNYNHSGLDFALLILRIAISAMMLTHGYPKLQALLAGGELQFADPFGFGEYLTMLLAVFAEVLCSILLLLGLATRLAAIPLIITMATVIFIVQAADGFDKKEMAAHYLLTYIVILIVGAGRFSIDHLISNNKSRRRR
jgi:putative oxidoreductase